jgi:hypothetical protein
MSRCDALRELVAQAAFSGRFIDVDNLELLQAEKSATHSPAKTESAVL